MLAIRQSGTSVHCLQAMETLDYRCGKEERHDMTIADFHTRLFEPSGKGVHGRDLGVLCGQRCSIPGKGTIGKGATGYA